MWPGLFPSRNLPLDRGLLTWAFCTTTWIFMQKNRSPGTRSFSDLCGWVDTLFSWGVCLATRISTISYVRKIDDTLDSRLGWIWWCGGWANGLGMRFSVSMLRVFDDGKLLRQSAVFETTFAALIVGRLGGSSGGKKLKEKSQGYFGLIDLYYEILVTLSCSNRRYPSYS